MTKPVHMIIAEHDGEIHLIYNLDSLTQCTQFMFSVKKGDRIYGGVERDVK